MLVVGGEVGSHLLPPSRVAPRLRPAPPPSNVGPGLRRRVLYIWSLRPISHGSAWSNLQETIARSLAAFLRCAKLQIDVRDSAQKPARVSSQAANKGTRKDARRRECFVARKVALHAGLPLDCCPVSPHIPRGWMHACRPRVSEISDGRKSSIAILRKTFSVIYLSSCCCTM